MRTAAFYLICCVVLWGWTFVAIKVCLKYVTPLELLGLRFVVGLPVMLLVIWYKRLHFDFSKREHLSLILGSAIITVHFLIQLYGLKYTSATNTGWIIAVTPLVMALMAFLILREKLGRLAIVGIAVATGGILLLISRGDIGSFAWLSSVGDWLILASAHTWAFYTIAIRNVTRSSHPLTVTFAVLVPSAVVVLVAMIFTSDWTKIIQMPTDGLLALLYLGVLGLAVAHWFWQEGVARIGAARSGIFLYLEPLATTALAVPFLGEAFGPAAGAGGLLVLAGVYLAQRRNRADGHS
jgi:drug/metabolite transporter (DMT)-like permease